MRGVLLLVIGAALVAKGFAATCTVSHRSMKAKQPLVLKPNGPLDNRGFIVPDSSARIILETGDPIFLACPGDNNYMVGSNALPWQEVVATCSKDSSFEVNGRDIDLLQVECYLTPTRVAVDTWTSCSTDQTATIIQVGFRLQRGFFSVYNVCFDKKTLSAQYTQHYVTPGGRSTNSLTTNSSFFFLDVDPEIQYQRTQQISTFTTLLGFEKANRYITTTNYIVSHQMVPRGDIVYWPAQQATYYYINSFPMWRTVSIGIWQRIQDDIIDLAGTYGAVHVHSAMYGVATLNNSLEVPTQLYLYANASDRRMIVPEFLVKEVTNERGLRVLFVDRVNEGAVRSGGESLQPICEDVCAELSWLQSSNRHLEGSSVFCCRADDPLLLENIPELKQRISGTVALLK